MTETFKNIPELFETDLGACITVRTESLGHFRELGPPDLVQVIKSTTKPQQKEVSSYHFVSGFDASSSASIAAYMNQLTYAMEEAPGWFGKVQWKITSGIYCCYNAFSRVDVRVQIRIPGGVECYVVDASGQKYAETSELWLETYVSSVLRSMSEQDSITPLGLRRMDPLPTLLTEKRFLEAAESIFWNGWQLGTESDVQVATTANNHLARLLVRYFSQAKRQLVLIPLLERLMARDPVPLASVVAETYFGADEEPKALSLLKEAMHKEGMPTYTTLHVLANFLKRKGHLDAALYLSKMAVNVAPSEFNTWAHLCSLYMDQSQYELALQTLNSCPMFTFGERDQLRLPPPARVHLPSKEMVGTSSLTLNTQSGAAASSATASGSTPSSSTANAGNTAPAGDDAAAGDGSSANPHDPEYYLSQHRVDPALQRLQAPALKGTFHRAYSLLTRLAHAIGWDELLRARSQVFVMEEEYRQVRQPVVPDNGDTGNESNVDADAAATKNEDADITESFNPSQQEQANADSPVQETSTTKPVDNVRAALNAKRLCERWLDNLFMVLYEDLRVYTIWKAEAQHYKHQNLDYRRTAGEWEILGELALRLHYIEDAKEAFHLCLESTFSVKAWTHLLEMYSNEGKITHALNAAAKLAAHFDRTYSLTVYPSAIGRAICQLVSTHGLIRVRQVLAGMPLSVPVQALLTGHFKYIELFQCSGYDW